jgi:hypothetical protein
MLIGAFPNLSWPNRAWPDRGWPEYSLIPPIPPVVSNPCPEINLRLPDCFTLYMCPYCLNGMSCLIKIKNEHRW